MIGGEIRSDTVCSLPQFIVNTQSIGIVSDRATAGIEITNHIGTVVDKFRRAANATRVARPLLGVGPSLAMRLIVFPKTDEELYRESH